MMRTGVHLQRSPARTNRQTAKQSGTLLAKRLLAFGLCCAEVLVPVQIIAQQPAPTPALVPATVPPMVLQSTTTQWNRATEIALPIAEDRGAVGLLQNLKRLGTWSSLMMIVAHPDDEDGGMLTYESRGMGVRTSLLTLTRGEGGQNAMSSDSYDALGVLRTNELLAAGEFYGVRQYWGTQADFGFSKTLEEAFVQWGHERVLCDTVLAVRRERPMVLVSSFIGGITDGHGQHQVSGEISQEAYLQAGDPTVCPEQIAAGLAPWSPLKVFARVPFAPITDKGMFDYATGKWAPAKFYNYVTKEWSTKAPSGDVEIPTGSLDPELGRSYVQIAREGWGKQKSQYGGANPTLSGGGGTAYHLYGSRAKDEKSSASGFFSGISGIDGLTSLLSEEAPGWLSSGLSGIASDMARAQKLYTGNNPTAIAPHLRDGYKATSDLLERINAAKMPEADKAALGYELKIKLDQFQSALTQSLGLDLQAFTVKSADAAPGRGGPFGGGLDETSRSVIPGQSIRVMVHTGNGFGLAKLARVWLGNSTNAELASEWDAKPQENPGSDVTIAATVPANSASTEPPYSRPSIAQPYYDVAKSELRGESFAPYPLAAWAEFNYDGVPIKIGEVVQTMEREHGIGGVFEPLVITPPIGVQVEPDARILPLDGSPLPVRVTVHSEGPAEGKVRLTLPAGWQATPSEQPFQRAGGGDSQPVVFQVKVAANALKADAAFTLKAEAESAGHTYTSGWRTVGYPGLRPYNLYQAASMKTRVVDAKVDTGVRVGYVMGTGDTVPEAIEGLGITPHLLTKNDLAYGDLSSWDVIMIGIRAYSVRPELAAAQPRLSDYVKAGGKLVVEYQSANFPAPFPLSMGGNPERVVEEAAPVKILSPEDRLMTWPNRITSHDFDGWVEERGHSFLDTWDPAYIALTETGDLGQDPQRGGLLVAHSGTGTFVYVAYAIYRQLPELVPGSYRLLANLLSATARTPTAPPSK